MLCTDLGFDCGLLTVLVLFLVPAPAPAPTLPVTPLTSSSCIAFTLNLQETHGHPISQAYAIATKQFVDLRSEHEHATRVAEAEARHYGSAAHKDPFVSQGVGNLAWSLVFLPPMCMISGILRLARYLISQYSGLNLRYISVHLS